MPAGVVSADCTKNKKRSRWGDSAHAGEVVVDDGEAGKAVVLGENLELREREVREGARGGYVDATDATYPTHQRVARGRDADIDEDGVRLDVDDVDVVLGLDEEGAVAHHQRPGVRAGDLQGGRQPGRSAGSSSSEGSVAGCGS